MTLEATEAECAVGRTAPRVSLDDIKAAIIAEHYMTGHEAVQGANPTQPTHESLKLLSICILVMRNGFVLIGKSAPASPANFDAALGRKLAYEDAVRQAWPLLGYHLRCQLHENAK